MDSQSASILSGFFNCNDALFLCPLVDAAVIIGNIPRQGAKLPLLGHVLSLGLGCFFIPSGHGERTDNSQRMNDRDVIGWHFSSSQNGTSSSSSGSRSFGSLIVRFMYLPFCDSSYWIV